MDAGAQSQRILPLGKRSARSLTGPSSRVLGGELSRAKFRAKNVRPERSRSLCRKRASSFRVLFRVRTFTRRRSLSRSLPSPHLALMSSQPSPFLLIFRDVSPDVYKRLSAEERQRLMQRWNEWYDGLAAQGKVQHGHPLESAGKIVSGVRGERVVDGPFAESHEAIGGYFLLSVADLDEATAIAQRCPSLPFGMHVEVRPIAEVCGVLGVRGRHGSVTTPVSA